MGNKHSEAAASSSSVEEFVALAKKEGINIENSILVMFRVSDLEQGSDSILFSFMRRPLTRNSGNH